MGVADGRFYFYGYTGSASVAAYNSNNESTTVHDQHPDYYQRRHVRPTVGAREARSSCGSTSADCQRVERMSR